MADALVPSLQVKAKTVLKKWRELPVPGKVLVESGAEVTPETVVAEAELPGDLYVMRIAEKLGIEAHEAIKGLKVEIGQEVKKGDLLCEHKGLFGLFNSRFLSEEDGTVEFISDKTGHLGLRAEPRKIELKAYVRGKVTEVIPEKGALIESECAFIQGIFGVGGEKNGILKVLDVAGDKELTEEDIPEDISGAVLVGGTKPSLAALNKAAALGAVGIVVGAIDDEALRGFLGYDLGIALTGDEQIPLTVIVTEGFGAIALSDRVLKLVKNFDGANVSINGATQVRAGALRPEIIIPNSGEAKVEELSGVGSLAVGADVRLIRVPYFGKIAKVVDLPTQLFQIETGAKTRVLKARLVDGTVVTVPRANVELL